MDLSEAKRLHLTRRQLFGKTATGLGIPALAGLLARDGLAAGPQPVRGTLTSLHHTPKAKRVICMHQGGAPSHIDLFDHKPKLRQYHGQELPDSVRNGQRITGMTSGQKSFPCVAPMFEFKQHGKSGLWLSEILPHTGSIADDICIIKSLWTEAINHDPAITHIQTGSQHPGRPSLGAWLSYGLGCETDNLPAYIVLISLASNGQNDQPLFTRLWGSGFLPSVHQGVKLRSSGDPVLYLNDPPGLDREGRRRMLDAVARLNQKTAADFGDPEVQTRIAQYELAYKMQASVPELMDLSKEPERIFEMYGPDSRKPGTYAANCILARRLVERGVRFVQLFHRGWDQHGNLPKNIRSQCRDTDQASAALVRDLKERGLLDETLVLWGGEFGRTVYCQGALTSDNYGRDHHGRCFSRWLAGGGIRGGMTLGETDDHCYNIVRDPVHVHDWNATLLQCLGIDHTRLTFRYQGRDFRLTDVEGNVVKQILA
ncbi:MAG: DUF1501 domain-containing protein [Armatimonadetes bacterium]|nr:DUF1501 domain-containing protein [Armatimonadota bacterium]